MKFKFIIDIYVNLWYIFNTLNGFVVKEVLFMKKDNKIISFKKFKKAEFKLKAQISIHILRKDESYILNWYSPDKTLSEEDIYLIQSNILSDLTKKVNKIEYKKSECYEIEFTLLYYEKSKRDFSFICIPQDIKNEKLIEYLYLSTSIYELKKSGAL